MTDNNIHSKYPIDSGKTTIPLGEEDDDDGEMEGLIEAYDAAVDQDYLAFEKAIPFDQAVVEIELDKTRAQLESVQSENKRLMALLERAVEYVQHINEVENSSCFYGCTCGAQAVADEIDTILKEKKEK